MYFANYDKQKNHIHICIKGVMDKNEFQRYVCDIKNLIDMAKEGFTVCADISKADCSVLENSSSFECVREHARSKAIKEVVTVIDIKRAENFKKVNNLFYSFNDAYNYLYSIWFNEKDI